MDPALFIDSVRTRPSMYLGTNDGLGLHAMLWELVGNALDEHLGGHSRQLKVVVSPDCVSVTDNGRGIARGNWEADTASAVDKLFRRAHNTPTADGHWPHVHVTENLIGVGLGPVCALSDQLSVEFCRRGRRYRRVYSRGQSVGELQDLGRNGVTGTTVTLKPDKQIFGAWSFDSNYIAGRLQEIAYLLPSVHISLNGRHIEPGDGISTFCESVAQPWPRLVTTPLRIRGRVNDLDVDLAILWTSGNLKVKSFVSLYPTTQGGAHEDGLWKAIRDSLRDVGYRHRMPGSGSDSFRSSTGYGMVAVLHVGMFHPRFGGPTRARLLNEAASTAVREIVRAPLSGFLRTKPQVVQRMLHFFEWERDYKRRVRAGKSQD